VWQSCCSNCKRNINRAMTGLVHRTWHWKPTTQWIVAGKSRSAIRSHVRSIYSNGRPHSWWSLSFLIHPPPPRRPS
jgi:hypothetical protein